MRETSQPLPADLARALEWLRGRLSEPVQLEQLAQIAGVRPRTLEAPLARQRLLNPIRDATVTDIAVASGISQFGRFAGEYLKAYGEVPSATLKRMRRPPVDDDAMDEALLSTLKALPLAFAVAPRECNAALEQLSRPIELAPTYGLPKAVAAWCWGQRASHRFSSTADADRDRSCRLAEEAYNLSPHDALTVTLSSGALVLAHRLEEADRRLELALALDPWLAYAWIRRGWMSAYLGDIDSALHELRTALHLAPFEPLRHLALIGMGCAYFGAERHDRAVQWVRAGVEASPGSFWATRVVVAAAALSGARAEARRMARQLMRKDPELTISEAARAWPFTPAFISRLADGLAIAGLPRG